MPGISNVDISPEERLRRLLKVELTQSGGDPSLVLTSLAEAVEKKVWERLGLRSLREFIEAPYPNGIGSTAENITTILQLKHRHESGVPALHDRLEQMRASVWGELNPALGAVGRPTHKGDNITITPTTERGTEATYTLRRLKRDAPALAQRVLDGELSANAAAVEAGFRKKSITIKADPASAAQTIARHFDHDQVSELIACLYQEIGG